MNGLRFTPDPKSEPKEKAKPKYIKPISDKKKDADVEYKPMRIEFLKLYPMCQFKDCKKKSIEVHHKFSGKDRSKYYLDDSTWMAVCRMCHFWIHKHPKKSRELDYLK